MSTTTTTPTTTTPTTTATPSAGTTTAAAPDLAAIKAKQKVTWASGDFGIIGTTLQIVGETLCEAVDLRATAKVLDVCAGNGNCSLAAARRFADVTSTDYVTSLLEDGKRRAAGDRLTINFQEADVEALPFADGSFDVVLSSFGVMFAPNQPQAASELLRVCRSGGKIGLANWTPRGFIGQLFPIIGKHVPPPAGLTPPVKWGTAEHLATLFGDQAKDIHTTPRDFTFRYRSPQHMVDVFRNTYGPTLKAFAALSPEGQQALERDFLTLIATFNASGDETAVVPAEYLEVVIVKK